MSKNHGGNNNEPNDTNKDNEEINKLKNSVDEFKNKYLRALADYQNLENRVMLEKEQIIRSANIGLVLKIIPFLDSLEKAEIFIKDPGLKMIKDNFYKILQDIGIEEINVLGQEFDPHLAEAIEVVEGEKDNIVIDVLRKGYRFNDRVIKPAQVKVSKKKINQKSKEEAKEELLRGDST